MLRQECYYLVVGSSDEREFMHDQLLTVFIAVLAKFMSGFQIAVKLMIIISQRRL